MVSKKGVEPIALKVEAILQWPIPQSSRAVRGFLGLTGFYRRFIKGYATIVAPLVKLTTKEPFQWTPQAQSAFEHLKTALSTTHVLTLPNFQLPFTVELFAITTAIKKWRQYLLGQCFTILIDHRNLKELLTQVIQTPKQHMYLARLMGYDYTIQYRARNHNQAADALSRLPEKGSSLLMILSVPSLTFLEVLRRQLKAQPDYIRRRQEIAQNPSNFPTFKISQDLILHNGRIWLPRELPITSTLLLEYHTTPTGGHAGIAKTLARISKNYSWPGIREDVKQFVTNCLDCQMTKYETQKEAGLLCPLPVPRRPWEDLSLDFIVGLPPYQGHTTILVVVDRFSKGIHLGTLPAAHTTYMVATLFINVVVKIHGVPRSLVSDRDPLFLSHFWQELFRASGTHLRMSYAYHPQSDGQTEVINRIVEQYLCAFMHRRPHKWGKLLPWIEWSHNTSWNAGTGSTPYEVTFGRKPFNFLEYISGTSNIEAVEDLLTDRDATFQTIRKKLLKAQDQMKKQADHKRQEVNYQVGDWVLLRLRPYRQSSTKGTSSASAKLAKRFYGPFQVIERIGPVAYKLKLSDEEKIHPVFHCSKLKPFRGTPTPPSTGAFPSTFVNDQPLVSPLAILDKRKTSPEAPWEVLVQWQGLSPDETSWENWTKLQEEYHLEDKVIFQGPRDDTNKTTPAEEEEQTTNSEVGITKEGVHNEVKPKRKVKRPTYLHDFV